MNDRCCIKCFECPNRPINCYTWEILRVLLEERFKFPKHWRAFWKQTVWSTWWSCRWRRLNIVLDSWVQLLLPACIVNDYSGRSLKKWNHLKTNYVWRSDLILWAMTLFLHDNLYINNPLIKPFNVFTTAVVHNGSKTEERVIQLFHQYFVLLYNTETRSANEAWWCFDGMQSNNYL